MNKAYKYRLILTDEEKKRLDTCFAVSRKQWNMALAHWNELGKDVSIGDKVKICGKFITQYKSTVEGAWMFEAPSRAKAYVILDLKAAFVKYYAAIKNGDVARKQAKYKAHCELTGKVWKQKIHDSAYKPKFKSWSDEQSFRVDEDGGAVVNLSNGDVFLSKRSTPFRFKVKPTDKIFDNPIKKFCAFTFSRTKTGRYYLSIGIDTDETIVERETKSVVGLDFGAKTMAQVAGYKVDLRDFSRLDFQIKKLQLKAASKFEANGKERTKNYLKLQDRIRRLNERKANIRKHETHLLTNAITSSFDFVAIEDLNLKGMTGKAKPKEDGGRNNKAQKAGLNRSLLNNNGFEIKRQLKYKMEWNGGKYQEIGRYFPSSKLCSVCGEKHISLELKDRYWNCASCGTTHDRDFNAEINIALEGLSVAGVNTPLKKCLSDVVTQEEGNKTTKLQFILSSKPLSESTIGDKRLLPQVLARSDFFNRLKNTTLRIQT